MFPDLKGAIAELRGVIDPLRHAVEAVRSEFAQLRALPPGDVAWDQVVELTVAAGQQGTFQLVKDYGKVGVQVYVVTAPAGAQLGVNGAPSLTPVAGRELRGGRVGVVSLDNRSGASAFTVQVALIVGRAAGTV